MAWLEHLIQLEFLTPREHKQFLGLVASSHSSDTLLALQMLSQNQAVIQACSIDLLLLYYFHNSSEVRRKSGWLLSKHQLWTASDEVAHWHSGLSIFSVLRQYIKRYENNSFGFEQFSEPFSEDDYDLIEHHEALFEAIYPLLGDKILEILPISVKMDDLFDCWDFLYENLQYFGMFTKATFFREYGNRLYDKN